MLYRMMDRSTFIGIFGSAKALADMLGQHETTVRNWFGRRSIPAKYDPDIIAAAAEKGRTLTPSDLYNLRLSLTKEDAA